jgi:hypothetical protein
MILAFITPSRHLLEMISGLNRPPCDDDIWPYTRASRRAIDAIAGALALPGLAADIAARATHLPAAVRAAAAARAW